MRFYNQIVGPGFGATFARVVAGSAVAQASSMVLALLVGMLLARTMGPSGLGVYSLAMSITAVLSIPTEFGMPTYLMREVATAHVRNDWGYLATVVTWCSRAIVLSSLAVIALVCLVLFALASQINQGLKCTILAALPIVLLAAQTKAREAAMRGMNLQILAQIPMLILRPGLFLLGLLVASYVVGISMSAPRAMLLHSLSMVFVLVAVTITFRANVPPDMPSPPTGTLDGRVALRAALPMAMTEGLRVLNGHLSVFLLGYLADSGAVGLFKVADSIGTLCALPVAILNIVAAPQITRLHASNDMARLRKLVSYVALAMTLGSLALALPVFLFGSETLSMLFGPKFADARTPMLILCLGYAMGAMLGPSAVFMNMTGRERTVTRSIAVSFSTNLVLGAVAVSYAGVAGAALANVVGYFVWNGWLWREGKRQAQVDTSLRPATIGLLGLHPRD